VAVIEYYTIPVILQFKAQEKKGRYFSISKILRNSEEEVHFGNRIVPEILLLEPITGIASYK
jgi:hypothetical protein